MPRSTQLETYVLLKYIDIVWNITKRVPEDYKELLSELGVRNLIDLERIIHKLHKELGSQMDDIDKVLYKGKGDVEFISYILETLFSVGVSGTKGDGVTSHGWVITNNYNMFVIRVVAANRYILHLYPDYDADIFDFADIYLDGENSGSFFDIFFVPVIEAGKILLIPRRDTPDRGVLLTYLPRFLGIDVNMRDDGIIEIINPPDPNDALDVARETYNGWIKYKRFLEKHKSSNIIRVADSKFLGALDKFLYSIDKLSERLGRAVKLSVDILQEVELHIHEEEGEVHLHPRATVYIDACSYAILPFLTAGIIALADMNPHRYEIGYYDALVDKISKIMKKMLHDLAVHSPQIPTRIPAS